MRASSLLPPTVLVVLLAAPSPAPIHSVERTESQLLLKSKSGYQTVSQLDGGQTGLYYDEAEIVARMHPEARDVVLLGLGGGEMLRAARRALPKAKLVGVEIDPPTAHLARTVFGMEKLGVEIVVADAEDWIADQPPGSIDILLIDIFVDDVLPLEFTQREFLTNCKLALRRGGVLVMNVHNDKEAGLRVMEHTRSLGLNLFYSVVYLPNIVLVASQP